MENEDPTILFDWFYKFMTANRPHNLSDTRVITAYHEAGHVLIAHNYELGFIKASLNKENPKRGQTIIEEPSGDYNYEPYACYMMAGIISQYVHTSTVDPEGFFKDYIRLVCHEKRKDLETNKIRDLFVETWNYFVSIIDNDVIDKLIIKSIVSELLMKGTINNDKLSEIISDLNSPTNSAEIILPDPFD